MTGAAPSAAAAERRAASSFVADGHEFFVSVTHHGAAGSGDEGTLDLALTDGAAAWAVQGLTAASLGGVARLDGSKLAHVLSALSDLQATGERYSFAVDRKDDSLALDVKWQPAGMPYPIYLRANLAPTDAPPVLAAMLRMLLGNVAASRQAAQEWEQLARESQSQAERSQGLVDEYVNKKEQDDKEMYAKVAALLNTKKAKLRELQDQLKEAQEEIERLKGGGGAAAMDASDGGAGVKEEEMEDAEEREGGGGGGGSKSKAREPSSSDEEEEDDEDDDDSQRAESPPPRDDY